MKRCFVVPLLLGLVALPARAGVTLLGFTADSSAVAWIDKSDNYMDPVRTLVVRDLNSLEDTTVKLEDDGGDSLDSLGALLARARGKQAWVPAVANQTSADGKVTLNVQVVAAHDGAWRGGSWSAQGASLWRLTVTRGGVERVITECAAADSLTAYWAPDGHRVVLVRAQNGTNMRDPGSEELFIGTDGTPVVAVAGPTLKAGQGVAAKLSKAGFAVTSVTVARKQRATTVVYVVKGQEKLGADLAAKLPGATVAPLDWASPFAAMVALAAP